MMRCQMLDRSTRTTSNLSTPLKAGNQSRAVQLGKMSIFPPNFMPDFKQNDKFSVVEDANNVIDLNSFKPEDDLVVSVSSVVKLNDGQVNLISRKMARLTRFRKLRLENAVYPSLIAGFIISCCDDGAQVINLGVEDKLAALAARLESSDKKSSSIIRDFLAA